MSLPLALSANPKLPKKQRRRDEDPPDPLFPPMGSFRPRWNMMFRRLEGIWSLTRTLSLDLVTPNRIPKLLILTMTILNFLRKMLSSAPLMASLPLTSLNVFETLPFKAWISR
ncbi:hypothetical protein V6N11_046111 [Hibiscus sabdariffa]|uniref:Uncharacterized protein n=2 Tax=Hibiscus sabdariffa TaxID=183260 RepID=A0ABR2GCY6_9ROSI